METQVRNDLPTSVGNVAGTRRRRRWPWIFGAILFLLAAAFGALVGWGLSNYQPLRANLGPHPIDPQAESFGETIEPADGMPFTPFKVAYANGKRFTYAFTLENRGPAEVTITQIGREGGAPLRQESVWTGDPYRGPHPGEATHTFEPFALASHETKFILVKGHFTGCWLQLSRRSTSVMYQIPVTFQFIGVTRHTSLPLPYSLKVHGNGGC